MDAHANLHLAFEQMRIRASRSARGATPDYEEPPAHSGSEPPRVMFIGPESSGKTTSCKTLANYAVRVPAGWTPLYINLDPSDVRCNFLADHPHATYGSLCVCREASLSQGPFRHAVSTCHCQQPHQPPPWVSQQHPHLQLSLRPNSFHWFIGMAIRI